MIKYKGYIGAVDFDPEIDLFHGTVINTNDVISFYGASVTELHEEMQRSIEGYLEFCKEQGKSAREAFSDRFRMTANLYCNYSLDSLCPDHALFPLLFLFFSSS